MDAQQTQPSDSYYNFLAWLEVNKRKVMIWAAAALAVVLVAIVVISYQAQKERRASEALSNVRAPSTAATAPPNPAAADAYLKVANEHAGTQAAARALLLAAATKFQDGAYADAQKHYEQFIRDYPESRWSPLAYFGVASSLDAQGKTADATKQFEELRRRFPNDAVMDETKLALARLYENQNRPAEAFKLYDDLVKANQYSGLGSEAGLRQAELIEKHPELAKTNMPPPMTTMPPMMTMTNMRPAGTNRATTTNRIQITPLTNTTQRPTTNTTAGQTVTIPLNLPTNSAASAKP